MKVFELLLILAFLYTSSEFRFNGILRNLDENITSLLNESSSNEKKDDISDLNDISDIIDTNFNGTSPDTDTDTDTEKELGSETNKASYIEEDTISTQIEADITSLSNNSEPSLNKTETSNSDFYDMNNGNDTILDKENASIINNDSILDPYENENKSIINNDSMFDPYENENKSIINNDSMFDPYENENISNINNDSMLDPYENENISNINNDSTLEPSDKENTSIINNGSTLEPIPSLQIPKLILVGFGNFAKSTNQGQWILFKVFFKRVLGGIPSKFLSFNIDINYLRRLVTRYLEEVKADCTRITDDSKDDIEYNCACQIKENSNSFTVSTKADDLIFGDNEKVDYTISSYANSTKNELQIQTDNNLEKGIMAFNNTVLELEEDHFILTGNLTEKITDEKVVLFIDENGDGNLKNVYCNVTNLIDELYEFECKPTTSINAQLQGISGRTTSTGKDFVVNFADGEESMIDIKVNNTNSIEDNEDNNNPNSKPFVKKSSSSGLSGGAIAGIIIGAVVLLIALITIIACCCRKPQKELVQESELDMNVSKKS